MDRTELEYPTVIPVIEKTYGSAQGVGGVCLKIPAQDPFRLSASQIGWLHSAAAVTSDLDHCLPLRTVRWQRMEQGYQELPELFSAI